MRAYDHAYAPLGGDGGADRHPNVLHPQPILVRPRSRKSCLASCICWTLLIIVLMIGFLSVSIYAFLFLTPFQADYERKATISKTISHGDLSSGMGYKFLNHKKDKGQVSLLVAVDVGSVDEEEHERGIAHMVEHLAFDSTEDFPGRATVWHEAMTSAGLFNAFTSYRNTVYMLLGVDAKVSSLQHAMHIIMNQVLKQNTVEENLALEKGAVLSEGRMRNESFSNALEQLLENHGGHSWRIGDRSPIGTQETVISWSSEDVMDFFKKWYDPSRFTLICVGDMSVKDMKKAATNVFGKAKSKGRSVGRHHPIGLAKPSHPFSLHYVDGINGISFNLLATQPYITHPHDANFFRRDIVDKIFSVIYILNMAARYHIMYPHESLLQTNHLAGALIDNGYTFGSKMHIFSMMSSGRSSEGPWQNDLEASLIELRRMAEVGPSKLLTTIFLYVAHGIMYLMEIMEKELSATELAFLLLGDMDPSFIYQSFQQYRQINTQFLNIGFTDSAAAQIQTEAQFLWKEILELSGLYDKKRHDKILGGIDTKDVSASLNVFIGTPTTDANIPHVNFLDFKMTVEKVSTLKDLGEPPLMTVLSGLDYEDLMNKMGLPLSSRQVQSRKLKSKGTPKLVDANADFGVERWQLGNGVMVNLKRRGDGKNVPKVGSEGEISMRVSSLGGSSVAPDSLKGVCDFINAKEYGAFRFEYGKEDYVDFDTSEVSLLGGSLSCSREFLRIDIALRGACSDCGANEKFRDELEAVRMLMSPRYHTDNVWRVAQTMEKEEEDIRRANNPFKDVGTLLKARLGLHASSQDVKKLNPIEVSEWIREQFRVGFFEVTVVGDFERHILLNQLEEWIGTIPFDVEYRGIGYDIHEVKELPKRDLWKQVEGLKFKSIDFGDMNADLDVCETSSYAEERAFVGALIPAPPVSSIGGVSSRLKMDSVMRAVLMDSLRIENGFTYYVIVEPFLSFLYPDEAYYAMFWGPGPYPQSATPKEDFLNVLSSFKKCVQFVREGKFDERSVAGAEHMLSAALKSVEKSHDMWLTALEGLSLRTPLWVEGRDYARSYKDLEATPLPQNEIENFVRAAASSKKAHGVAIQTVSLSERKSCLPF
eukprot:TRINITY_DN81076_c0_g1_i1.p1 TRINITY_DN81076_c0_g1~~TRINITY_DN81076_c0_g1_i1.p1  ORF type:complete len:1104 (+),score=317.55 TRINITY_DN81076_c0_g1_i1:163-3474(+)